jgi:translation initiation factor IF-1
VTKLLGNGMCHVWCQDDKTRLCIIRGRFRGKNKRDNMIAVGKWILIGLREYETEKKDKMDNCDLLEIYSDHDKEELKIKVKIDWRKFIENDSANTFTKHDSDNNIVFSDEKEDEYKQLIENNIGKKMKLQEEESENENEEIDIDDI